MIRARARRAVESVLTVGNVATFLSRATCRVTVEGAARLPRKGPALLVVNHTSITDTPVVLSMLYHHGLHPAAPDAYGHSPDCPDHAHVRFLAVEDLFHHRILGPIVSRSGFIPVHLRDPRGVAAYEAAIDALRKDEIVALYPEGDVTAPLDGAPRRFRSGAARLALAHPVPIVPIAHHDARRIGHGDIGESLRGAMTAVVRRPRVRVVVGRTIDPSEYAGLGALELTRLIRERLTATWERAARD